MKIRRPSGRGRFWAYLLVQEKSEFRPHHKPNSDGTPVTELGLCSGKSHSDRACAIGI